MNEAAKKKIFDNRYEILSIVGRGSGSVVYLAKTLEDKPQELALKVLVNRKGDINSAERLRKEAIAMVAARHKHVMRLDDFNSVGDISYLSMDYAPGSDLRSYMLANSGKLSVIQAERFLKQMAEAMAHLHLEGILHQDIKPENILVMNDRLVKLTDFGVASLPGETTSIEELQKGVGTLDYMAPEVLDGTGVNSAADVYSLALTFYEVFSGSNPLAGISLVNVLSAREDGKIPALKSIVPEVSDQINNVIMKGLRYNEEERYPSGSEFLSALNTENKQTPSPIVAPPIIEKTPEISAPTIEEPIGAPEDDDIFNFLKELEQEHQRQLEENNSSIPQAEAALPTDDHTDNFFEPAYTPEPVHIPEYDTVKIEQIRDREEETDLREDFDPFAPQAEQTQSFQEDFYSKNRFKSEASVEDDEDQEDAFTGVKSVRRPNIIGKVLPYLKPFVIVLVVSYIALQFFSGKSAPAVINKAPTSSSETIKNFPLLAAGTYTGKLYDFGPETSTNLTVISLKDLNKLLVIVGIPGWQPAIIDLNEIQTDEHGLKIASNGFILRLTADKLDEGVVGTYENSITKQSGKWELS